MKKLLFVLFAFAAIGATAQNGVTNNDRQGKTEEEKKKCIQAITIMNTNVKNKNYSVAYDAYRTLFNEYPVARVDTYTNGIKILREFIAKETFASLAKSFMVLFLSGQYMTSRSSTSTNCRRLQRPSFLKDRFLVERQLTT